MCKACPKRNPFHCIVPPYIQKNIEDTAEVGTPAYTAIVNTRFQDAIFRNKRALLAEMTGIQMRTVIRSSFRNLIPLLNRDKKGNILRPSQGNAATIGPDRAIYDAQNSGDIRDLPGKLIRKEGASPVKDTDAKNIYDNNGHTWDFYNQIFGRDSLDGKGLTLINSIHFGLHYDNAAWEGTQMVYGDGGEVFKSFTNDIEITAHELTHGVVQYEASFEYQAQSGAINESIADVFGIMVRQFVLGETAASSDWLIGRNCIKLPGFAALRSMKAPGTAFKNHPRMKDDLQPAHMNDFKVLPITKDGDFGGVHINSGILNHAFYLSALALGGNSWEKAGKIWYQALCDATLLNTNSQFADLSNAAITVAEKIFGVGSNEAAAVKKAWNDVGL